VNPFEHSFTLIALVLGLALTHVLSEFVQAVRTHGIRALGVLTPMLAIFVILDIATFWGILWEMRLGFESVWPVLGYSIILSSFYYIAATYVFPVTQKGATDFDAYYMQYRRLILGIMLACYLAVVVFATLEQGHYSNDPVSNAYMIALILTIIVPWRRLNAIGLVALIIVDMMAFMVPT
jgi:hypothetical protein